MRRILTFMYVLSTGLVLGSSDQRHDDATGVFGGLEGRWQLVSLRERGEILGAR